MRFRNVEFYGFGGGLDVSETHFAQFALPALLCAEPLDVDSPDVWNAVYSGGVHLQEMQQDAVNHAKKCGCSSVGGHNGDVEDGKMKGKGRKDMKQDIPNPKNLPCVNHKDENKENNIADNLEWCTVAYNNAFGRRTERSKTTQIKNALKIGKTKPVRCIETGAVYESSKQAERDTGIYHSHISRCCKGKAASAGGKRWEYA